VSRIALVWELGAGLGHLDRLRLIGRELRARGHDLVFVLRDLRHAYTRLACDGFRITQAPVRWPRPVAAPFLGNYASVLAAAGWMDPEGLAGQLAAWRALFELLRLDAVVADHAPTAVAAARALHLPTCLVGNSFQVPPAGDVFPPILHWVAGEAGRCAGYDAMLLPSVNEALRLSGQAPLMRLTELLGSAQRAIFSVPELAHYGGYAGEEIFVGPSFADDLGHDVDWPDVGGPRVFAYLDAGHRDFDALVGALRTLAWPSVVHGRGLSPERAAGLSSPGLRMEARPVRVASAIADAHLVITHASIGTVTAAVLAGKPQLALPAQAEQWMVGRRIAEGGIGLLVDPGAREVDFASLCRRLVDDPAFIRAAEQLATRHAGASPAMSGRRAADRIEGMLGAAQPAPRAT
jgi:hypothetical protein